MCVHLAIQCSAKDGLLMYLERLKKRFDEVGTVHITIIEQLHRIVQ